LRRSNVVQQLDGGRVTSVVVVLPVATSNSNLSLASLHYETCIHQHRWPVVVHISPLMTLRFFTISLMNLCCRSFCFFLFGPNSQRQSSSSCALICCSRWLQARGSQLRETYKTEELQKHMRFNVSHQELSIHIV
jgi:hypothetical protein